MRKLNLTETNNNVQTMAANKTLYGFYGLTENADYDKYKDNYVREHFRFSCEGNHSDKAIVTKMFTEMLTRMQMAYLDAMNLQKPLFKITNVQSKVAPYDTIVIDIDIENVKGAFVTIVNCAGPDLHQFHASDIWVRANATADVWKSLFDYSDDFTAVNAVPFTWIDVNTANKWLEKVRDARIIAKECITTMGEPTEAQKEALVEIMKR